MYTPKFFKESNTENLLELVRAQPLGTLVFNGEEGPEASHIPFVYRNADSGAGLLCAHIPRVNSLSEQLTTSTPCLVIFHGPQGYMSPSWYATKQKHGRVVPTWNYRVTHVRGTAVIVDDASWVSGQINELTDQNESNRREPWAVSDAPDNYTSGLIKSLVGVEITISEIFGVTKASQNQPKENKASILEAVSQEKPESGFSEMMLKALDPD